MKFFFVIPQCLRYATYYHKAGSSLNLISNNLQYDDAYNKWTLIEEYKFTESMLIL